MAAGARRGIFSGALPSVSFFFLYFCFLDGWRACLAVPLASLPGALPGFRAFPREFGSSASLLSPLNMRRFPWRAHTRCGIPCHKA